MEYLEIYPNRNPSFKLEYKQGPRTGKELSAYADADWATDVETRKSISGQGTLFNSCAHHVEVQEADFDCSLFSRGGVHGCV